MRSINIWSLGLASVLCLPVNIALAQGGNTLEEVVVTAQRREETLQEVPLAISVFTGKSLEQDSISNLQDIGSQTPGLVFTAFSVGQPEISIRGISSKEDGASANDSTVVSVDDVYIAARTAQVFDIFDLERVEVVRGPQATLYGKNSIGGTINFVTLKPTDEKIFRIRQTVGNFDRYDTGVLLSGPLSEDLAAKVSFSRRDHGGWLNNLLTGKKQGGIETYAWRTQAVWTPSSDLEFVATFDGANDDIGQSNREPIGSQGPLHDCPCAANPVAVNQALGGAGSAFDTLADTEGFTDREVYGLSLKTSWDFSDWASIVAISSFRHSDFNWLEDSEGLPPTPHVNLIPQFAGGPPIGIANLVGPPTSGFSFDVNDAATERTNQFTQELRLVSNKDNRLRWIGGFFYSLENIHRTETFNFTALGIGPDNDLERSIQRNETNSVAVYGQVQYDVLEKLTATLGLRYSYEKKKAGVGADNLSPNNPAAILLRGAPFPDNNGDGVRDGLVNAEASFDNVSWRVALNYAVDEDISLYMNIATGFKSGGFSGSPSTAAVATRKFDEEDATNFEFGLKSRLLEDRVMINLTGFFVDYKDLQVTRFFQPVGNAFGEFITENAGKADISGIEFEFAAVPTEWLEIGGNYAYLDATFKDFQGSPSIAADGTITDAGNFNGNRLRIAPKNTASGYIMLSNNLGNGGKLNGKFKARYQDDMFFDPDNNPINVSPSHTILDVWAAYTTPDNKWEFKLWAKNLTDKEYVTHGFTQRGSRVAFGIFGEPRSYGGTVTYNFF